MTFKFYLPVISILTLPHFALADGGHNTKHSPDAHAPISVMGDHMHAKGEWMVSYRFMQMHMEGNIRGTRNVNPNEIVTEVANPNPGPPTVRVVPIDMSTDMHMLGLMYAPSDKVTLMLMLNYVDKRMDHFTYAGMMGTTQLGRFTTRSSGVGDTKIGALWRLYQSFGHKLHFNLGISLPTGDVDKQGEVLTPMNMRPTIRLPYPMQLGSGTYDFEPGITYSGKDANIGWGLQYKAILRVGDNEEGYALGDTHKLSTWASYRIADSFSISMGADYQDEDEIDGRDPSISAPVQTANPQNFGGTLANVNLGVNFVGQNGTLEGHRVALEYQSTVHQEANGVQMKMQDMLVLGYQFAF